jgi:hypothetical protein
MLLSRLHKSRFLNTCCRISQSLPNVIFLFTGALGAGVCNHNLTNNNNSNQGKYQIKTSSFRSRFITKAVSQSSSPCRETKTLSKQLGNNMRRSLGFSGSQRLSTRFYKCPILWLHTSEGLFRQRKRSN